ncbi:unnamed protein product [Thlaspi arvense]|uniref:DUF1985 domain-containing protein n=1 Tax=Thlaspi arvense TaxID=13288 RepID=A0AAU9RZE2_THLAR|nr:unnamed protein product [Thlaspi arvense]
MKTTCGDISDMLENDPDMPSKRKLQLSLLIIVDCVLIANSHVHKPTPRYVRMVRDLDSFLAFPWGRESFLRTVGTMLPEKPTVGKNENPVNTLRQQLSSRSMRLCGFPLALQLLAFRLVPQLLSKLHNTSDQPTLLDMSGLKIPKQGSLTLSQVHQAESERELTVTPLIDRDPPDEDGFGEWDDETYDKRVKHLFARIRRSDAFHKQEWSGGDTSFPLIVMKQAPTVSMKHKKHLINRKERQHANLEVCISSGKLESDGTQNRVNSSIKDLQRQLKLLFHQNQELFNQFKLLQQKQTILENQLNPKKRRRLSSQNTPTKRAKGRSHIFSKPGQRSPIPHRIISSQGGERLDQSPEEDLTPYGTPNVVAVEYFSDPNTEANTSPTTRTISQGKPQTHYKVQSPPTNQEQGPDDIISAVLDFVNNGDHGPSQILLSIDNHDFHPPQNVIPMITNTDHQVPSTTTYRAKVLPGGQLLLDNYVTHLPRKETTTLAPSRHPQKDKHDYHTQVLNNTNIEHQEHNLDYAGQHWMDTLATHSKHQEVTISAAKGQLLLDISATQPAEANILSRRPDYDAQSNPEGDDPVDSYLVDQNPIADPQHSFEDNGTPIHQQLTDPASPLADDQPPSPPSPTLPITSQQPANKKPLLNGDDGPVPFTEAIMSPSLLSHMPSELQKLLAVTLQQRTAPSINPLLDPVDEELWKLFKQTLELSPKLSHFSNQGSVFDNNFFLTLATPNYLLPVEHLDVIMRWLSSKQSAEEIGSFCSPYLIGHIIGKARKFYASKFKAQLRWDDDIYRNDRDGDYGPVCIKFMELHLAGDPQPHMFGMTVDHVDRFRKHYALDIYRDLVLPLHQTSPTN